MMRRRKYVEGKEGKREGRETNNSLLKKSNYITDISY